MKSKNGKAHKMKSKNSQVNKLEYKNSKCTRWNERTTTKMEGKNNKVS